MQGASFAQFSLPPDEVHRWLREQTAQLPAFETQTPSAVPLSAERTPPVLHTEQSKERLLQNLETHAQTWAQQTAFVSAECGRNAARPAWPAPTQSEPELQAERARVCITMAGITGCERPWVSTSPGSTRSIACSTPT